ncbi:MAG TPA: DNA polymerase Y family protein, partial [Xanthomonadaceae bacterium]|nr:DNA polymerase Y family protein [Xanthomonadaceae bacterium]
DVVSTTPSPVFSPRRAPQRHLDALATERGEKCGLARISLPAPVHAIAVEAADLPPLLPEARDLFSTRSTPALPLPRLIERLCARLGEDAVCGIEALADHRPERAWRRDSSPSPGGRGPFDAAQGSVAERGRPKRNVASGSDLLPQPLSRRERGAMAMPERPLWLLERPEPVRSGSFQVLSGPERIESGWWDDGEVRRDYYIARDAAGRRCWLFRDRGGWFLQGLFG